MVKSRSRRTNSISEEAHSSSIAETTIMVGKISSRRIITRGPPCLSSSSTTNKRSNVQGKVTSHAPTSRNNTLTKGKTRQNKEEGISRSLLSKLCSRQISRH